ncbi:MAG: hypothetical protein ACKOHK_00940, partial [Planctomycetia bacterium]
MSTLPTASRSGVFPQTHLDGSAGMARGEERAHIKVIGIDGALRTLRGLTKLGTLSLNDTAVTAAAVTAFGQAHPQCV